jgi:hypothetical protein
LRLADALVGQTGGFVVEHRGKLARIINELGIVHDVGSYLDIATTHKLTEPAHPFVVEVRVRKQGGKEAPFVQLTIDLQDKSQLPSVFEFVFSLGSLALDATRDGGQAPILLELDFKTFDGVLG